MATLSLDKAEALPSGPGREKYERSAAIWTGLAMDMDRIEGRAAVDGTGA
ncbi:hypothetical protein IC614_07645 [Allosphingosinicella flava]|uniref:Uncharacterized protein n=2 Tax=Allosphingosinicella flava TaxID=2771430 RepID=A0A7T2GI02_9SPHN|nr:hypothetical protein IC614_07645 [Sphingosinicella flava]